MLVTIIVACVFMSNVNMTVGKEIDYPSIGYDIHEALMVNAHPNNQ